MSDEQDKSYVEELSDMWNENGWLLDAIGGKDMVQQDSSSEDNTFNYLEEVAKSMQPNTSQPAAMVASAIGKNIITNPKAWSNGKAPSSYGGLRLPAGMAEAAEMAASMLKVPAEWVLSQFIHETRQGSKWAKRAYSFNFGAMTPNKRDRSYATKSQERINGRMVWAPTRWAMYDSPAHFAQEYANRIKRKWGGAVGAKTLNEYIAALAPHGDGGRGNYFTALISDYQRAVGGIVRNLSKYQKN